MMANVFAKSWPLNNLKYKVNFLWFILCSQCVEASAFVPYIGISGTYASEAVKE